MNAVPQAASTIDPAVDRRGFLLVLSSPSGAGKTTITRRLLQRDPALALSVSVTTRPPRQGEREAIDYYFIDQARFEAMVVGGELLEHATVFGHSYGTPRDLVEAALGAGRDIVTDIDWQGTQQIGSKMSADLVTIFVLPPSMGELAARLRQRAQDSEEVVAGRMAKSAEEMSHWSEYEYVIINTDLDRSVAEAEAIIAAERLRRTRQIGLAEFVNLMRAG